ncbi:hypothetical protein D3C77_698760 [compost metagenome]
MMGLERGKLRRQRTGRDAMGAGDFHGLRVAAVVPADLGIGARRVGFHPPRVVGQDAAHFGNAHALGVPLEQLVLQALF